MRSVLAHGPGECDVTVLVPAYNEIDSLPSLVERLHEAESVRRVTTRYEILVVDDGSTTARDRLREIRTERTRLRAMSFLRNYGKSAALAVGFREARGRLW